MVCIMVIPSYIANSCKYNYNIKFSINKLFYWYDVQSLTVIACHYKYDKCSFILTVAIAIASYNYSLNLGLKFCGFHGS